MSAPKQAANLPFISPTNAIRGLAVGDSCICSGSNATAISAEFSRLRPMKFGQQMVFVVHPRTAECQKMFVVTRKS